MTDYITSILDAILQPVILLLTTIIGFAIAYIENMKKNQAEAKTAEVAAFYDPKDNTSAAVPEEVTERSWKMSDGTKSWLTTGHSEEEKALLLKQVAEHEAAGDVVYTIVVPTGTYNIEYGLISGSSMTAKR